MISALFFVDLSYHGIIRFYRFFYAVTVTIQDMLICLDQLAAEEQFFLPLVAVLLSVVATRVVVTYFLLLPPVAIDKSGVKLLATNVDVIPFPVWQDV